MIIALAQLNYHIGNFEVNTNKIIAAIQDAKGKGADLIVFAELAVGGYPAKDLLRSSAFLKGCEQSILEITPYCEGIACIIGAPIPNASGQGKALYNAALFIADGAVQQMTHKVLLPDYDVFDEYRYFQPANEFKCIAYKGKKIALTICEDLWNIGTPNLYRRNPMDMLSKEQPDFIVNIAASPFAYNQFDRRYGILQANASHYQTPLFYLNQIGAHVDLIFDGCSMVLSATGDLKDIMVSFEEDLRLYKVEGKDIEPLHEPIPIVLMTEIQLMHQALILGIRDYFNKSGFKKAVLGLSGGLDSALVAALACEAIGAENVMAVLMPSIYSSDHSIKDALDLVDKTGCNHQIIPIKETAKAFDDMLSVAFVGQQPDITEENIQARIRATILMAMANKFGYILLNTSNKSEASVGYGTLYGDMAGALSVIGDVYKTQAYQLAKYINRNGEIIPTNTIVKPPSAELRPGQKDSDSLPEYELLDAVLFHYIEGEKTAEDIIALGFDHAVVHRVLKLVNNAEFKRFQAPPILRVSPKAFGSGRAMPLVAKYPI